MILTPPPEILEFSEKKSLLLWELRTFPLTWLTMIQKKEVCLRQKSPETWKCLPNPTFFTDFKSFGFSLENSATSKWMPFFIFFKNFILDFFCLSSIFQIVATFVNNHATSRAMFLFSSPRTFCLLTGRCGAKNTENEKWPPFWGRWMNLKTDSIFKLRKRNWIM